MAIYQLGGHAPRIPESSYIANEAAVIGQVTLGERSSVWPGAVLRGDNEPIRLGAGVNVQDGAVVHVTPQQGVEIGPGATVGHLCVVHAAHRPQRAGARHREHHDACRRAFTLERQHRQVERLGDEARLAVARHNEQAPGVRHFGVGQGVDLRRNAVDDTGVVEF